MARSNSASMRTLKPVRPNAGDQALYRARLDALIREMQRSIVYWLTAAYRANEPVLAQDGTPAIALQRVMKRLSRKWQKRFDELGPKLAEYFATSAEKRSTRMLEKSLRDAGFTVRYTQSAAMTDALRASMNEQVSLIKSIPQQYFTEVEGLVMRSVSAGRDLGYLSKELEKRYGITRRRAAFIARDQVNKAQAITTRVRQLEAGIEEAIWVHSGGGRKPRPTHLKAGRDKARYDIRKGWHDPAVGQNIWPGELPNCRCVSRAVVPGFS